MEDLDKFLENKYPITVGMSQKNCNKALRSRHYFEEGYLFKTKEYEGNKNEQNENKLSVCDISSSCESPVDNTYGDLVPLIWMIEQLRQKEGCCIMNELVAEVKRNFKGIEQIKHRTINYC